jgi:hypothetical protein
MMTVLALPTAPLASPYDPEARERTIRGIV